MLRLRAREDLDIIEVVQGTGGLRICRWFVREGRDDVEALQHVARQIRGVRSRGEGEGNRTRFTGENDGVHGWVEGEGLVPSAV